MFMITPTQYKCKTNLIKELSEHLYNYDYPLVINEQTGSFFNDPWKIKKEFKDSLIEQIYNTLPSDVGQARIIKLDPGKCYHSHADIDDRYHLNISGEQCYLVNLTNREMFEINDDGIWYEMDASFVHSAINFGRRYRFQLVIRKLLPKNILQNPVSVKLTSNEPTADDARYVFDNTLSPWLNKNYKDNNITNFNHAKDYVTFDIEKNKLNNLYQILPQTMEIQIDR